MCRFTLYLGPPIKLSSLLLDPAHSLIRQSSHSHERDEPLNGDGFGVGWYTREPAEHPAVFRSITPAWNNRNLRNLARVIASSCILAHVRAATLWSGVNEANCHPFRYDNYLFMHNGDIGNFMNIRRKLLDSVCDDAFNNVYGSTDSEHFFAIIIDELLKRRSVGLIDLAEALHSAIQRVRHLVMNHGDFHPSYLNVAIADGHVAVASRYTDDPHHDPESLYYFNGQLYDQEARDDECPGAVLVSSERLTNQHGWLEVPPNHIIMLDRLQPPQLMQCT